MAAYPRPADYKHGPDAYADHIVKVKRRWHPVIASLNGHSGESWLKFARIIEQAGADALEFNYYDVAAALTRLVGRASKTTSSRGEEPDARDRHPGGGEADALLHLVRPPRRRARSRGRERAGAVQPLLSGERRHAHDGLVPQAELSTSAELRLRLHWLALLHGRVRPSLAATGGVATPDDGIKALLAGADVVQLVSALLRHGPGHLAAMRQGPRALARMAAVDSVDGDDRPRELPDPSRSGVARTGPLHPHASELDPMTAFLTAFENSALSTWLRESNSIWAYPTVLTLHTIGLALLVGANAALDLRCSGLRQGDRCRSAPPRAGMWIGFWVNALSGACSSRRGRDHQGCGAMFVIKMGLVVAGVVIIRALDRRLHGSPTSPDSRRRQCACWPWLAGVWFVPLPPDG